LILKDKKPRYYFDRRFAYFVWDSYFDQRYQLEINSPQVVSLLERKEYMGTRYAHPLVWVNGRNFTWKESRLAELQVG